MKTIHKFELLPIDDGDGIEIGQSAQILSVGFQDGKLCLWALVDTEREKFYRYFYVFGTGHAYDVPSLHFVGHARMEGPLELFVFEQDFEREIEPV